MNWKQSLDRYLTTPPDDCFDNWAESTIESLSEDFYKANEEWVDKSEEFNFWLNELFYDFDLEPKKAAKLIETLNGRYLTTPKNDGKKEAEKEFLEMFNRIKKSMCEKRNKKFTPTRTVSKPSQLHARLKDYKMEELGKVIYNALNDNFHIENKWIYVTTEYVTRQQTIEKYLS